MDSSNKGSFKMGWQWGMRALTGTTIALLGLGLLIAILFNISMAKQLEEVIRDVTAQQQKVRSSEKLAEDAQRQSSEELGKAEASLGDMSKDFDDLVKQLQSEVLQQKTDRQKFRVEMNHWREEREAYNRLLNNLSTKIERLSDSSDVNGASDEGAGGTQ